MDVSESAPVVLVHRPRRRRSGSTDFMMAKARTSSTSTRVARGSNPKGNMIGGRRKIGKARIPRVQTR